MNQTATPAPTSEGNPIPEAAQPATAAALNIIRGRTGFENTYAYTSHDGERVIFHDNDASAASVPCDVLVNGLSAGILGSIASEVIERMTLTGTGTALLVPPGADPDQTPVPVGEADTTEGGPNTEETGSTEHDGSAMMESLYAQGEQAASFGEPRTPPHYDDEAKTTAWLAGYDSIGTSERDTGGSCFSDEMRKALESAHQLMAGSPSYDSSRQYLREAINVLPSA